MRSSSSSGEEGKTKEVDPTNGVSASQRHQIKIPPPQIFLLFFFLISNNKPTFNRPTIIMGFIRTFTAQF